MNAISHSTSSKIFYTLYRTLNIINNKIYVGAHATTNIYDKYIGSGKFLKRAIKKYGIENFKKDVFLICSNENDMYLIEGIIVNEEFIKRPDVYNFKPGGEGGSKGILITKDKDGNRFCVLKNDPRIKTGELVHINKGIKHSDEFKENLSKITKGKNLRRIWITNGINSKFIKYEEYDKYFLKGWKKGMIKREWRTEEHNKKISKANKDKCWINLGDISKKIKKDEIEQYLNDGWKLGRIKFSEESKKRMSEAHLGEKNSTFGTHWMYDTNNIHKQVKKDEINLYLQNGWKLGKIGDNTIHHAYGTHWITKGDSYKQVKTEEISGYLKNGWVKGAIKCSEERKEKMRQKMLGILWINNGRINKRIQKDDFEKFKNDGWNLGQFKTNLHL